MSSDDDDQVPEAPRRQQNLQGVLRYSIEAQAQGAQGESSTGPMQPMDPERRTFLEATLRSMTVNPVEYLAQSIQVVRSSDDVASCEEALDQMLDLVDNIDNAMDFHKIGGFSILSPTLCSPHSRLRSQTCLLIGELSQNNPYVQTKLLDTDLLGQLLNLIGQDSEPNVKVNALFSVSCMIRGHDQQLERFIQLDGFSTLLKAITSSQERLQLKTAFLVTSLCSSSPNVISHILALNYVEQLCALVSISRTMLLEHLLQALLAIVENSKEAVSICLNPQLQLDSSLEEILRDKEESSDEHRYARQLKAAVFGSTADLEEDGER